MYTKRIGLGPTAPPTSTRKCQIKLKLYLQQRTSHEEPPFLKDLSPLRLKQQKRLVDQKQRSHSTCTCSTTQPKLLSSSYGSPALQTLALTTKKPRTPSNYQTVLAKQKMRLQIIPSARTIYAIRSLPMHPGCRSPHREYFTFSFRTGSGLGVENL